MSPTIKKAPTSPRKDQSQPDPQSPSKVLARVAENIPADADAAETFYSQHEDFEDSGSDSVDEDIDVNRIFFS